MSGLTGFVEDVIKALVLAIVANLMAAPSEGGTPVLTGWARANWIPVIGSAATQAAPQPGSPVNAAQQVAAQGQAAIAVIAATYKLSMGPVSIYNNVPYILKLDAGSSRQAPKGFIRRGIEKAIRVDLRAVSA